MDMRLVPFDVSTPELDQGMPVEVMRDFDTVLLFGKLAAVSSEGLTIRRVSKEVCFPVIKTELAVLVRCYDTQMNPVLLCAKVIRSSGLACTVGELELIPYKTHRRHVRYPLCPPAAASALAVEAPGQPQPCQLLNISDGGACIVSESLYAVGQALCLRVKLAAMDERVSYPCKVTRIAPRRGGCYEYGLLFEHFNGNLHRRLTDALYDQLHVCFAAQEDASPGWY